MHDLDALATDPVGKLLQVRGALVVPGRGQGLQQEAAAGKAGGVGALAELRGGEAVAVGRVWLDGVLELVWFREPGFGVDVALCVGQLDVEGAGDAVRFCGWSVWAPFGLALARKGGSR